MYITNVISHLGAWGKLRDGYPIEFQDLHQAVANITTQIELSNTPRGQSLNLYGPGQISEYFQSTFAGQGWQTKENLIINGIIQRKSVIDAIKNSIGVEYTFGQFHYTESVIFVKFPLFVKAHKFKIGLVITPSKSLVSLMPKGVNSFEMVRDRIRSLAPLPFNYPFAIIGISEQNLELKSEELTSKVDQYLFEKLGVSLTEMTLQTEKPNYDFKETLPTDNHKIAKEICAFANMTGGGLLLVGVNDDGYPCGVLRKDSDLIQQRVMNIATAKCIPLPEIETRIFELSDHPDKCLLTIYVSEIPRKPCMTDEKVYIRAGSSARAATSDEIRKMVLGIGA